MSEQTLLTTFTIILAVVMGMVLSELSSIKRRLTRLEQAKELDDRSTRK